MRMKLTVIASRSNLLICDIYVSAWLKLQILLHNISSCFDRKFHDHILQIHDFDFYHTETFMYK